MLHIHHYMHVSEKSGTGKNTETESSWRGGGKRRNQDRLFDKSKGSLWDSRNSLELQIPNLKSEIWKAPKSGTLSADKTQIQNATPEWWWAMQNY